MVGAARALGLELGDHRRVARRVDSRVAPVGGAREMPGTTAVECQAAHRRPSRRPGRSPPTGSSSLARARTSATSRRAPVIAGFGTGLDRSRVRRSSSARSRSRLLAVGVGLGFQLGARSSLLSRAPLHLAMTRFSSSCEHRASCRSSLVRSSSTARDRVAELVELRVASPRARRAGVRHPARIAIAEQVERL